MNLVPVDEMDDGSRPAHELFLDLAGPLRLTDGQGSEWTPKSRKGQGLLALLATSPGLRRSRIWLQDKLWSDRGPTQGAASLRQCLRALKVSLGRHSDCLRTGFGWIELDPARVCVRTGPCADDGVEFLEGLDIRDPEFEDWLRDQRTLHAEPSRRSATRAPDASLAMMPGTHRVLGDARDPDYYGAMMTAAAIAGYLLHERDRPKPIRPPIEDDVLETLLGGHAARAMEIAGAFSAFLATHGREVFDGRRALHAR